MHSLDSKLSTRSNSIPFFGALKGCAYTQRGDPHCLIMSKGNWWNLHIERHRLVEKVSKLHRKQSHIHLGMYHSKRKHSWTVRPKFARTTTLMWQCAFVRPILITTTNYQEIVAQCPGFSSLPRRIAKQWAVTCPCKSNGVLLLNYGSWLVHASGIVINRVGSTE